MNSQISPTIEITADAQALARRAAELFIELGNRALKTKNSFHLALSGGSTPKAMFGLLADTPYREQINWGLIDFWWGDERCVPPDHPDSNYGAAFQLLLSKVAVDKSKVHRMKAEQDPDQAAADYAAELKSGLGSQPQFDLVFLGMGPDGHTASLFPGSAALHPPSGSLVVANYVEKFSSFRITLTADVINAASEIAFLAGGADKAEILQQVLYGPRNPDLLPSQLISPLSGHLRWILDTGSASRISPQN